jgi:hypothetical protein
MLVASASEGEALVRKLTLPAPCRQAGPEPGLTAVGKDVASGATQVAPLLAGQMSPD